jgi:5-methylcytosine-specific restriction endonuclease McrA
MKRCGMCGETKPLDAFHKNSRRCKPCANEVSRQWRRANPDKVDYSKLVDSKARERARRHYANNLDRSRDLARARAGKRRAVMANAEQGYFPTLSQMVWFYGPNCMQCGSSDRLHIDHVVPVSKGGDNGIWNLQLLCQGCNLRKGNRVDTDHRPYPRWVDRVVA